MPAPSTDTNSSIIYFCKDCQKIVDAKKEPRRFVYICGICGTKNVAFGTEKSIRNFYHVEEAAVAAEKEEKVEGL